MELRRHTMLYLNDAGIAYAVWAACEQNPRLPEGAVRSLVESGVPAILCRQEQRRDGIWEVGFSASWRVDGSRFRVGAAVPAASITGAVTPYDAVHRLKNRSGEAREEALEALLRAGEENGVDVGIYGSFALEVLTGLPYTNSESDLDICIRPLAGVVRLGWFYQEAQRIARAWGVVFDIEAECGGFGVKLAELLSDQRTVLGKGLYGVALLPRSKQLFVNPTEIEETSYVL